MTGGNISASAALVLKDDGRQTRPVRFTEVRAVKALPDRVEIHRESGDPHTLPYGIKNVSILAKDLGRHVSRRRHPLATFLYFPEGEGAVVLVQEQAGRCAIMVAEA